MPLDPQMQDFLDAWAEHGHAAVDALPQDPLRKLAAVARLPEGPTAEVEDRSLPGPGGPLALRVYRPTPVQQPVDSSPSDPTASHGSSAESQPLLGGLVFFSGGGFVLGELAGHDALCRQLAVGADCVVVSVGYRLAPEHRFPAAVDDAYAATCWVHEHADCLGIDYRRLAIGGYTAGATLATVVARLSKERRNPPLAFQLLLYPLTDLRSFETPSHLEHAAGAMLTREAVMRFASLYVPSAADRADPRCSPLAAKNLIGLPTALIITAEYDPLRDEGEAYAAALRSAHVDVTLSRYAGVVHGFVNMHAYIERGRQALFECQRALRDVLATRG